MKTDWLKAMTIHGSAILLFSAAAHGAASGWKPESDLVDRFSRQRSDTNYREEKVPDYTLPSAMETVSGKPIRTWADWEQHRRPELLDLFREYMYGIDPGVPPKLEFAIVELNEGAMGGRATLKRVKILCGRRDTSLSFQLVLFLPNERKIKPAPVMLLINHRDRSNMDPTRENQTGFWPAEEMIERGYGAAAFQATDVDPDFHDGFMNGVHAVVDPLPRRGGSWGTLSAWAWGASRCMDYLVTDGDVDASRVAVVGHSRGGKTALWAGANDPRFAMVVSNDSGCGGAALSRRRYGETVERINKSFPHWFCENFNRFNGNEDALPVDQHLLVALMAPRKVYVASASEDLWADPRGEFLSLVHASPVFGLLDASTFLRESMPPVNTPVRRGAMGYHIREGGHDLTPYDWHRFMDHMEGN